MKLSCKQSDDQEVSNNDGDGSGAAAASGSDGGSDDDNAPSSAMEEEALDIIPMADTTASSTTRPKRNPNNNTHSLHEHLHHELRQLITVESPKKEGVEDGPATVKFQPSPQQLLNNCIPPQLLMKNKNEGRRLNKVNVATRLLDTLQDDQTGLADNNTTSKEVGESKDGTNSVQVGGRIHGCVGSHWELLPPVYAEDGTASGETDAKHHDKQGNNSIHPPRQPVLKGGGLRLPGLDWNKTFRKGYSVLVWVRPSLDSDNPAAPHNKGGDPPETGSRHLPHKQVLYRFATSPHDRSANGAGVCAILGQWKAVPISDSRTMLTTTVTAYTLPNADPMSHLYPSTSGTTSTPSNTSPMRGKDDTIHEEDKKEDRKERRSRRSKGSLRGSNKSPSIGFKGGSGAHARNMEHFQKLATSSASASSTVSASVKKKVGTAKKSVTISEEGGKKDHKSHGTHETHSAPSSGGKYVTANITLPANEWSLIGIQHTHPYLRRPELLISVNGEEMMKSELGYPILDAVVFPSSADDRQQQEIGSLASKSGSNLGLSKSTSSSPMNGGGDSDLDEQERLLLRRRGILAECTLFDGAFDNGVQTLDSKSTSRTATSASTCSASVHSVALLAGPPVPNAVLAIVAERGPLGDSSSSGSGLSFVLGPVPTNPQNRDAIVALSAGHGYYGSTPDSGAGERGSKSSKGGIMGVGGPTSRMHELAPPRSLGIPVSIGITPGVYPGGNNKTSGNNASSSSDPFANDETWIGQGEEHAAHVCLQGLLGRVAWTFHSADTKTLGTGNAISFGELAMAPTERSRIVCPPSAAPSRIGGADAVPKVGIVRPTPPSPPMPPTGMEVTGNACYRNTTWDYIQREKQRGSNIQIGSATPSGEYNLDDNHPISFPRAIQASNAMNLSLLPFRLALPHAGNQEVNDVQRAIHVESFAHLNDLLSNDGELAERLIRLVTECIRCGGSAMRDEALQNGVIHVLATLVRKVLIRGARLGLLSRGDHKAASDTTSSSTTPTKADTATQALSGSSRKLPNSSNHGKNTVSFGENYDYDKDHDSSCPPIIPMSIANAIVGLIDACCGPSLESKRATDTNLTSSSPIILNPCRGLLRVRRASDLALTALFGLAMDFDLLGNDPLAAAPILKAIASRYCQGIGDATAVMSGEPGAGVFNGEDYGSLLRKQINLQYFLDCLRIRFDHSVESLPKGLAGQQLSGASGGMSTEAVESVASSLSDILYTMLLSTLTSAAGVSVSRGERDVGALVATLTECPLGSVCAHVVTTSIARLLVKCGVMCSLCLGFTSSPQRNHHMRKSNRRRDPDDIALESRLGRNLLLCHYHDIVAPLLLSRSTPRFSLQPKGGSSEHDEKKDGGNEGNTGLSQSIDFTSNVNADSETSYPLDWTHHWRLSLLTFAWLSSLAGMDESKEISTSTGHLLLLAGKAGSLNRAILGCKHSKKTAGDMLAVLSHFLVLSSSREDNSVVGKRAESISRRLSAFVPLVPGIAQSLLSSSVSKNERMGPKISITVETVLAVGTLKQLLSMLSLAIQALYGSKKGGLLSAKAGAKGGVQMNRAKKVFVAGAKQYVPILLQVVSLLDEPIRLSRHLVGRANSIQHGKQSKSVSTESRAGNSEQPSDSIQRKRTDSSDKDWVNVHHSPKPEPSSTGDTPSDEISVSSPLIPILTDDSTVNSAEAKNGPSLEQSVYEDMCSVQDMALYAVSRLVAQAMKYGGGEASTAVWRSVIASLSGNGLEKKSIASEAKDGGDPVKHVEMFPKLELTLSKSTLCHLAALVLSKFARHHDRRLDTYRSPWNLETCSAVARLMDLVEEKQLLSQPEKMSRRGSIDTADSTATGSRKYSIDQVRLLKALLEVMASGRESGGWSQIKSPPSHSTSQEDDEKPNSNEDAKKNEVADNGSIDKALPHSNYELYHQAKQSDGPSNSKLLLPILQSCVRIVVPATGIIRSEAVVITSATGNSPSTAKLLELVCTELHLSLIAAIEGLGFPVSRDIFMNGVASLRRSITHHENAGDSKAVALCSTSLMAIVNAMRLRYLDECTRKERASFDAYEDDEAAADQSENSETKGESSGHDKNPKEGLHSEVSEVIEKLILGDSLAPKNDADFVAFPGDANHHEDPTKLMLSPMGWSHYKGLGASLNKCHREEASSETLEDKAKLVLSILESYIDNWDKIQIQDAAEAELVDLFDESINFSSTSKSLVDDFDAQGHPKPNLKRSSSALVPTLSASDAMARFIEAQSMLRHQHQYLAFEYLLRRRFGRTAFVERLCWKTWMDCIDSGICNGLWERAINDGGRDFSSKITTLPLFPQFPRFIPSYLDHSPSSTDIDIKLLSKSVKIVDITKKEISEEMLEKYDSLNESAVDDAMPESFIEEEEADLHFGERRHSEPDDDGEDDLQFGERRSSGPNSGSDDDNFTGEEKIDSEPDGMIDADSTSAKSEEGTPMDQLAIQQGSFHFAASSFSFPPDSSSLHSMGEGRRLGGGSMEEYYSSCLQVKPDCSLKCTIMLTESHLIVEYEDVDGTVEGEHESNHSKNRDELSADEAQKHDEEKHMRAALRPKAMRWNISEASHIYLRRYRLRDSALELFFIPSAGATTGGSAFFAGSRSLFIDFGAGTWGNTRRDDAANAIMRRAPMQTVKQWPDKSGQFLHEELKKLMQAWSHGAISNFDYLLSLNVLAGRSYNDICQYPVFPWVLSNYTSEEVPDLQDRANFRDMTKPMGALNEDRLAELQDRFQTFDDPSIPPFMYGSHYSTSAGVVIHFLLRLHPFSSLHRQLQSGHFDVADRLFSSVQRTWDMCTGRSAAEVKELTPEFYSNPSFLRNSNEFKLGTSQEGEVLGDVILPPWAKGSPERFVEVMRLALESDIVSEMLPDWIDLVFGRKQQGKAAIEANNVYFYLTYYGSVDVASIEDEGLRQATELQIAHFGQCPMQLFYRRHAKKQARENHHRRQTLSDLYDMKSAPLSILRSLDQITPKGADRVGSTAERIRPFIDAPLSYWVHLGAPPPGPHAPLISLRLALADRCLAVDSKGIFHFFRWAWKPDFEDSEVSESDSESSHEETPERNDIFSDKGCFVAQRELFSFRNIPRLPYASMVQGDTPQATVGISKTLFANRSLLLVVSDGDGKGALAMQLVDPIKGEIRGEVIVPSIHADCITSIDMDPIGTASGQGGVGGELVIVGSADGCATLWRFISSHYWPLRPRLRMMGHGGAPILGVAISSSLGVCASVSSKLCCLFDVGNGAMIRNFTPPKVDGKILLEADRDHQIETTFANTSAVCLSVLGFVVVVSSTKLMQGEGVLQEVFSLELFTVEGRHISSRLLEPDRGMPRKIFPTCDGRAVFVCAGGGVSVHLLSSIQPLVIVDKWGLSEDSGNDASSVYDLDFGPTIARPVVAAAACSAGTLRLHALRGISKWSHEHQRNTMSSAVGNVLALPAQTVKNALGGVSSFGSSFFGSAKEISKEAFSVVKEREGGFFFRKKKG